MILTTELHDVWFGADPFAYMKPQLAIQSLALHVGNDPQRRRGNWRPCVISLINGCVKHDAHLVKETLAWIETNPRYQAGCGIIGGGAHTFKFLIDEMVAQFQGAPRNADCNMGILQTTRFHICQKQQQCLFLIDAIFHAEFCGHKTTGHVVYHKSGYDRINCES